MQARPPRYDDYILAIGFAMEDRGYTREHAVKARFRNLVAVMSDLAGHVQELAFVKQLDDGSAHHVVVEFQTTEGRTSARWSSSLKSSDGMRAPKTLHAVMTQRGAFQAVREISGEDLIEQMLEKDRSRLEASSEISGFNWQQMGRMGMGRGAPAAVVARERGG